MSRREDIDNAIWTDPDFEALSPNATLLYIWSFTNLRCGMAGIYKVSRRQMIESKVPEGEIPATLAELERTRFAFHDDQVLWVRTRVKHLRSKSPQMATGVVNDLLRVPEGHVLRDRFIDEYRDDKWLRDALKRTYTEGIGTLSEKPVDTGDSDTLSRPSTEGPGSGKGKGPSRNVSVVSEDDAGAQLPADFPTELTPHLDSVVSVLADLAARHNAKAVKRLSVASVIMARRFKPLVKSAHDYAAWADGQTQRRVDVVAGYRNWLEKANDLAAIEPLGNGQRSRLASVHPTIAHMNRYRNSPDYQEDAS